MEDRSELFNQLKGFSQRKLKKVETKVVTGTGEQLVEKRGAKGLQVLTGGDATGKQGDGQAEAPRKLDLQVGFIVPGFLIGSQDVAHDKSSLESYGITHILNLDADVENKFEDDYNHKNVAIEDRPEFELERVLEDCFDFIDDGRHYGNVLVHCSGTIGLSRSTSICVAYLMSKEKQTFDQALTTVKEARSFVRPNEGFIKQLKEYEVKLRGAQKVKDSGIDDPFALRKKQEIEQEKAMVAGAASVKNRMKLFGAQLDASSAAGNSSRSKSVSPSPDANLNSKSSRSSTSIQQKPSTPEPRKSWQSSASNHTNKFAASGPPPPPPPPPSAGDDLVKLKSSSTSSSSSVGNRSKPPPPPPPPGDLTKDTTRPSSRYSARSQEPARKSSLVSTPDSDTDEAKRMVFGRKPPPPMKIRGGLSIERQDSTSDKNMGFKSSHNQPTSKSSLQLPLKKQFTNDSDGVDTKQERAPSPSAALKAAKQQANNRQIDSTSPTSDQHRPSVAGLNRSSTKKLLNLIKTKTRSDLTLPDGDENDEIEALLGALESESIENIDWDELGLDEDQVKDIINQEADNESSSSSSSSSSDEGSDEEEEIEEEVETSTQHFIIRSK